jgi:hypothetical protein
MSPAGAVRKTFALLAAAAAAAALAPAARAQTLLPGDRLVYETGAAFGFEREPALARDPATVETRIAIGIGDVDEAGMDVDVEVAMGVRAVRYAGPSFCWAIEPATPDGFIGAPLTRREEDDLTAAVLPRNLSPLARDIVRKELALLATVAALHGCHASARVAVGPEPFVRVDHVEGPSLTPAQRVIAERYLRTALLLAFPPVPLALGRDPERYDAGGSRYEVTGYRDAYWPIRGREHRVRALEPSSAARAAFAFEAVHDCGLEPLPDLAPAVREWADIHATLGIAGRRHVRVASALGRPGDDDASVFAVATWTADLVRATRVVRRRHGEPGDGPISAPGVQP